MELDSKSDSDQPLPITSSSLPLPLAHKNHFNTNNPNHPDNEPPRESLIQYRPPEIISTTATSSNHLSPRRNNGTYTTNTLTSPSATNKTSSHLSDVLNSILPPLIYTDPITGSTVRQSVSTTNSSRDDVISLQLKLDSKLQDRQARDNGICPVREELFGECFSELIRQVTCESAERGLLLLRVRDEVRLSIAAYSTLYNSSMSFGMRKSLQAEQGQLGLQQRIDELEVIKAKLRQQVAAQKALSEAMDKRAAEQRAAEEKKMAEEKDFLKFQAQHLESFLKQHTQ